METIKIKYFDKDIYKIEYFVKGDLIDLRSAETVELKKGVFHLIPLGVGMKLPIEDIKQTYIHEAVHIRTLESFLLTQLGK